MKLLGVVPLMLVWLSRAGNGAPGAGDPPQPPGLKPARLHVIASELLFAPVNPSDATPMAGKERE